MKLYRLVDESPDRKKDPEVFVKAETAATAAKRGLSAMESNRDIKRVVIERVCDLDTDCYEG